MIPEDQYRQVGAYGQELVELALAPTGWKRNPVASWLWSKGDWIVSVGTVSIANMGWFKLYQRRDKFRVSQKFQLADPDVLEKIRSWADDA